MAKETIFKENIAVGKEGKRGKSEAKLSQKLQAELECALLRLFESTAYCDVELIAESDSILTHSCILQARVSRFYNFLITECDVLQKNGFSSIIIYNVSFVNLRNFIENIYKNVQITEVEDFMLRYLLKEKCKTKRCKENRKSLLEKSNFSFNASTPDTDLFYTPKCSPSEIEKSFVQTYSDSPIRRQENDITCYYKIVSVDDVQTDEKYEVPIQSINETREENLQKELAEQDELLFSFKSIFSKVNNKCKSYSTKKKEPVEPNKKFFSSDEIQKPKRNVSLWRTKFAVKTCTADQSKRKTEVYINKQVGEMEVSIIGVDSGLETSSSCPPETSLRETTVSETSGLDLTEAAINEDIPHDEERTISTKPNAESISSSSSEVGTWDVNDEKSCRCVRDKEENGQQKETLNEEEIARLDAMEKNIRECEKFLDRERRISYCFKNEPSLNPNSEKEYNDQEIKDRTSIEDSYMYDENIEGLAALQNINSGSDIFSKNLINHEIKKANISILDRNECFETGELFGINHHFNSLAKQECDSGVYHASSHDMLHIKTPPCSPRQICKLDLEKTDNEEKSDLPRYDRKCERNSAPPAVNNFFIDASSLLDEDEIIVSPPMSLSNFEKKESKAESSEQQANRVRDEERRQGELIFKNSIPHFSRHEIDETEETMARFRVGTDSKEEFELVVPHGERSSETLSEEHIDPVNPSTEKRQTDRKIPWVEESGISGKRLDTESLPIVSGGALPEDFPSSPSHVTSPHLRRRNESAPIMSGGMDWVEEKKKTERKPNAIQSAAWVVSFEGEKHRRKKQSTASTTTSESELESLEYNKPLEETNSAIDFEHNSQIIKSCSHTKDDEDKFNQRTAIEKSASLGYFIEFGKENVARNSSEEEKTEKGQGKKNIFSMFIDMKDDSNASQPVPCFERQNTYNKESGNREESIKKSFYMFIESDSSAIKRKPKKTGSGKQDRDPGARSGIRTSDNGNLGGSTQSLLESISVGNQERKQSELPLPLCKSNSLSSVTMSDFKITAWSEKKEGKVLCGETWLKTNDVQVTYKGRHPSEEQFAFSKKASTFVIPEELSAVPRMSKAGDKLRTVNEKKSPEERDSGVIMTEESDDSFVKLSDMDNFKNPYLEADQEKTGGGRMTQSIPASGWTPGKVIVPGDNSGGPEMSRSTGSGVIKSNSGTIFISDEKVSRSLSRIFPNLNLVNGLARKSGGRPDADPSDTQVSEVSEMSSMQSSIEPSALDISTSETDVSCHNGTSRLGEDLLRMFLEEISPDVIVEVGGRRMKAHKCILSSRCQYFAAMLSGGWVESAGNVISLQGFSYSSVHFALCHIYSGENRIPDSLNIIELATLADMLCLEGLKEVISHTLKVKYCHCFHIPCDECHIGVLDCLPVAAAYGLDDLYRKCLRWITRHFVKVWPSKTFASLPKELLDKCYQHNVVHMTVENVLDTILNIDKVRGSLPNVRWSETISRLITKLYDAAVKYIADHFSSILTCDNFLALGKDACWSVGRLEDSLMEATKRLPPEQACWSHARLHRILTVAKGPDPPSEMDWNEDFIDLLQCISSQVENSLIKQAPRAAKSKAWRQMEPELRNRIQERACLVLPDETQSPRTKRTGSLKWESKQISTLNSATRSNYRNLEIRHMKLAMTQQVNRTASLGRNQSTEHNFRTTTAKELCSSSKPVNASMKNKKSENLIGNAKKSATAGPDLKKYTPSRFLDVKSRYLESRSPQKTLSNRPSINLSNVRRTTKPLSSSDSSRNCSPLNANPQSKVVGNVRQHRDSTISTESKTNYEGEKREGGGEEVGSLIRSETSSCSKTISLCTGNDNTSTDPLFTDSLYSGKDATTKNSKRKPEDFKPSKGKANVRRTMATSTSNAAATTASAGAKKQSIPGNGSKSITTDSPSGRKSNCDAVISRKVITTQSTVASETSCENRVNPPKRFPAARMSNLVNQTGGSPGQSRLSSPRNTTNSRHLLQKKTAKYNANVINGNAVKNGKDVDNENNKNGVKDEKRPSTVSRSGTFLKDEPTILKKPHAGNIENSF